MRHEAIGFALKYFCEQVALSLPSPNPVSPEHMCQYFWWNCETCSLSQDFALYCQYGVSHSPCKSYTQPTLLPLITPPPTCQRCGSTRGTKQDAYALPPHSSNTKRDGIFPELKAILNDRLFWVDPSLRILNNMETMVKYIAVREKIFEDAERETKNLTGNGDNDQQHSGQDRNALEAAWKKLRKAVVYSGSAEDVSEANVTNGDEEKMPNAA